MINYEDMHIFCKKILKQSFVEFIKKTLGRYLTAPPLWVDRANKCRSGSTTPAAEPFIRGGGVRIWSHAWTASSCRKFRTRLRTRLSLV